MYKPDMQLLKDLDSLYKTDARFQRVADWFRVSLAEYREAGDLLDGNDLHRNQGKCIVLKDLVECVQTAGDLLQRSTG